MPTYLALGTLTQHGYDTIEQGPDRVERFVELTASLGGEFRDENFYVTYGSGEYGFAAILDLPDGEVASRLATAYARTGAGRIDVNRVAARGADGYREYVETLPE